LAAKGRKYKRGALELDQGTVGLIQKYMTEHGKALFQIDGIVEAIARHRLEQVSAEDVEIFDNLDQAVGGETVAWNKAQLLDGAAANRPRILINALMSIDYIESRPHILDVLCVGPRLETELFLFAARGFDLERVRGLDVMSYSDYIDLGDMHAMPYDDNSFDIVFLGWVLGYSGDPGKVAAETLRVCRPGGYVAVACTRPLSEVGGKGASYYYKVDDILRHFDEGQIRHVYLRHEPSPKLDGSGAYVMTVFERT